MSRRTNTRPDEQRRLDDLWHELEGVESPSPEQVDEFIDGLLALPPELARWSRVLDTLAGCEQVDLPRVFRRIADTVPPSGEAHLSFFFWKAADEFVRRGRQDLLPEVASKFRVPGDSYDADALWKIMDILLAEGFEAETLELAEHYLPIMRDDDQLTPWAVPDLCALIFDLRVGRSLRSVRDPQSAAEVLAGELRRDLEDEVHIDVAQNAVVAMGQVASPSWTRAEFELPLSDPDADEVEEPVWQEVLRLHRVLIQLAKEAWQIEHRPPGSVWRGLLLVSESMHDGTGADPSRRKPRSTSLLDCLRPAGIEPRVAAASPEIIGINVPRARLLLDAHEALLRFAKRHGLISSAAAARSAKELRRLQDVLSETD